MTCSAGLVADAPESRREAPPFERHKYSRGLALREGPCVDSQAQVGASAGPRKVALHARESEAAMKEAVLSDEPARYSRPSPPKSTPVPVQHGPKTLEMNITGNHMLLALVIAFCLAGPLAWAFVRYWLFAL